MKVAFSQARSQASTKKKTKHKELKGREGRPLIVIFESFEDNSPRTRLMVPLIRVNSCPFVVELFRVAPRHSDSYKPA